MSIMEKLSSLIKSFYILCIAIGGLVFLSYLFVIQYMPSSLDPLDIIIVLLIVLAFGCVSFGLFFFVLSTFNIWIIMIVILLEKLTRGKVTLSRNISRGPFEIISAFSVSLVLSALAYFAISSNINEDIEMILEGIPPLVIVIITIISFNYIEFPGKMRAYEPIGNTRFKRYHFALAVLLIMSILSNGYRSLILGTMKLAGVRISNATLELDNSEFVKIDFIAGRVNILLKNCKSAGEGHYIEGIDISWNGPGSSRLVRIGDSSLNFTLEVPKDKSRVVSIKGQASICPIP